MTVRVLRRTHSMQRKCRDLTGLKIECIQCQATTAPLYMRAAVNTLCIQFNPRLVPYM